jgi:ubiquitin-protein ligase E3 C
MSLATSPFSILAPTSLSYQQCLTLLFVHILTIPLNRLPRLSQTDFSSRLPLSSLDILSLSIPDIIASSPAPESRFNLIANLYEFTRPLYGTLSLSALDVYLHFLTELMDAISIRSFELKQCLYQLDPHTKERLVTISGADHLTSLLIASKRYPYSQWSLASFLLSLGAICPTRRDNLLSTLLGCPGGNLVQELYREFVRTSPLWRDYSPKALMGISYFLLLLAFANGLYRPVFRIRMASTTLALRPLHPIPPHHGRRRVLSNRI